ncbi:MAG TPA: PEP-CTERM sorting domain-containing protein, partial [Acidobacteriota bacterium]|nr:PEP-CTERM sorting domain-containing protein [Acidobacteriota bacterium]
AVGHTDQLFDPVVFATNPAFQTLLPDSVLTASASVSAVPEPATYAGLLGALGLGATIMRRRRAAVAR